MPKKNSSLIDPLQLVYKLLVIREALKNSSMNDQGTSTIKNEFILLIIFNGASATEHGNTSLCCGTLNQSGCSWL